MSLTDKVQQIQEGLKLNKDRRNQALERAERLAEQFADIRPQSLAMPMEKYFGFPSFHNEKNA